MSEADFAESFFNLQELGIDALMLYLTVISGYLAVAYVAGRDLTAVQTRIISTIFVVFAAYSLWGVIDYWSVGDEIRKHLNAGEFGEVVRLNKLGINPAVIAGPMGIVGVLAALHFMKDIRRREVDTE